MLNNPIRALTGLPIFLRLMKSRGLRVLGRAEYWQEKNGKGWIRAVVADTATGKVMGERWARQEGRKWIVVLMEPGKR